MDDYKDSLWGRGLKKFGNGLFLGCGVWSVENAECREESWKCSVEKTKKKLRKKMALKKICPHYQKLTLKKSHFHFPFPSE